MNAHNKRVFVPGNPLQLSLIFVGKARAYLSVAPLRCSTLWKAPGLIHKHFTMLERLARDKHASLLRKSVNYGSKSCIELSQGVYFLFDAV